MRDEGLLDNSPLLARRQATPARPGLTLIVALVTSLISAAVCTAAILAPAPALAIPFVVAICIGCPMFAGWEVPNALAALRAKRADKELAWLCRSLAELPETEHPLGY
jgi:hypothetical protein